MSFPSQSAYPHVSGPFSALGESHGVYSGYVPQMASSSVGWPTNKATAERQNDWSYFFGENPNYKPVEDHSLAYRDETKNLPQAFQGANTYLSTLVVNFISVADQWVIREVLPWKKNDTAMTIHWDKWIFDNHLLNRNPEQSVPRLLTSRREARSASQVRVGIAMALEYGFMSTPRGRETYWANLRQMANAVIDTLRLGAFNAILNCNFQRAKAHAVTQLNSKEVFTNLLYIERDTWGCYQKSPAGAELCLERLRRVFREVAKESFDYVITPAGSSGYIEARNLDHFYFMRDGIKVGKSLAERRGGITVREWSSIDVGYENADEDVNPAERQRVISDFYFHDTRYLDGVPPAEFRTSMMDTEIYDEGADAWIKMSYRDAVANSHCFQRRQLDQYSQAHLAPQPWHWGANAAYAAGRPGTHDTPTDGPVNETSDIGMQCFGVHGDWRTFMEAYGVYRPWVDTLLLRTSEQGKRARKDFLRLFADNTNFTSQADLPGASTTHKSFLEDDLKEFGEWAAKGFKKHQQQQQQQQQQGSGLGLGLGSDSKAAGGGAGTSTEVKMLWDVVRVQAVRAYEPGTQDGLKRFAALMATVMLDKKAGALQEWLAEDPDVGIHFNTLQAAAHSANDGSKKFKALMDKYVSNGGSAANIPALAKQVYSNADVTVETETVLDSMRMTMKQNGPAAQHFVGGRVTINVDTEDDGDTSFGGRLTVQEKKRLGSHAEMPDLPLDISTRIPVLYRYFGEMIDNIFARRVNTRTMDNKNADYNMTLKQFGELMEALERAYAACPAGSRVSAASLMDDEDEHKGLRGSAQDEEIGSVFREGMQALLSELYYGSVTTLAKKILDAAALTSWSAIHGRLIATIQHMYQLRRAMGSVFLQALAFLDHGTLQGWRQLPANRDKQGQTTLAGFKALGKLYENRSAQRIPDVNLNEDTIGEILASIPISNADLVMFSLYNDLWPLFHAYGHRLNKTYVMSPTAVLCAYGKLGFTLHGHHSFTLQDNSARGVHFGNLNLYAKSVILFEEKLQIAWNTFCVDYVRGNNTTVWDFNQESDLAAFRRGDPNQAKDIVIFLGPPDEIVKETYINITGFDHPAVASDPSAESFPSWHATQAAWIGIKHPTRPVLEQPQIEDQPMYNTVCFQAFQWHGVYKGTNHWDPRGAYTLNKGHWGPDDGMPGNSAAVRKLTSKYMLRPNLSEFSYNQSGQSSAPMSLRT